MPFEKLQLDLGAAANEEEVRLAWVRALEASLGVTFKAERDKLDLNYNHVVIEFKGPHKFGGRTTSTAFQEAMYDRLLPYICRTAEKEGIAQSDYIGIAIDSSHLAFAQVLDDEIRYQNLLPINETTFSMVTNACRSHFRRPITAQNLIEDFGHKSPRGIAVMRAMAQSLDHAHGNPGSQKIRMLFEEWRTLYAQVADLSPEQLKKINGTLLFARAHSSTDVPARLFVVHTYNSLLIKLLAAEIVAHHGLTSEPAFASQTLARDDDELIRRLESDIEEGGLFSPVGLRGFIEEAIFSWYLDVGDHALLSAIAGAIRQVLAQLALYRTHSLGNPRDV